MKTITINVPSIGKNWRTTLTGLLTGVGIILYPLIVSGTPITLAHIGAAIATTVYGMISKDANVTGGTIPATPEAEARTTTPASPEAK